MTIPRALVSIIGASLVLAGVAGADGSELQGSVGPGFAISLSGGGGAPVTHLDPGSYTFVVTDKSNEHDFHLQGPGGVNVSTGVDEVGTKTLSAKLVDGKYTYFCDIHPSLMAGDFTVGTPPADPTPTPTPKPPATSPAAKLVLKLTSTSITLTSSAGAPVKALSAGAAVITVRDLSKSGAVKLRGAGAAKSTTAAFVGTVTWRVSLSSGTLVYTSDPRKPSLAGGRVKVS
jgi:hypothetical protein